MHRPDYAYEILAQKKGFRRIAGVDEAGRGPLAGPVVAAACIFLEPVQISAIDDSKKLTPKKRDELFHLITKHPSIQYGVGIVSAERIDEINILQATFEAMKLACLQISPDYLLIDGNRSPCSGLAEDLVVKGDAKSISIAAASIIAKVTRDRIMLEISTLYPQYGFDCHMGYPTKHHLQAIHIHGLTPVHRKSYAPVKKIINVL